MSKYPENLYSGISDDSDSWGMCCGEEEARRCAEDWYDRQNNNKDNDTLTIVKSVLFIAGWLAFFVGAIYLANTVVL